MDVYNKLTFINRILDQSEGINEWMFVTSLHSLTEPGIQEPSQPSKMASSSNTAEIKKKIFK